MAKYYKNTVGFDGWRFDYVKSFHPRFVKAWMDEVGGWAVGEFFDGNANLIRSWMAESGTKAFDFPCLFTMQSAFAANNLNALTDGDMLWKTNPNEAVTFVANHDTDREPVIANDFKSLAYAFILTHPGYPTIFYLDIENNRFRRELENLILIKRTLALGGFEVLYVDGNEYIALRGGNAKSPGLVIYMNLGDSLASRPVKTSWNDSYLADYSKNINGLVKSGTDGNATLFAPANSYAIWSVNAIGNR
ncbi:MAG: alpha-amylase domain-containing protein [Bacteroidota bacterium]